MERRSTFDWGCLYSDDSAIKKGYCYRAGSLDLERHSAQDLESIFTIPSLTQRSEAEIGRQPSFFQSCWINSFDRYVFAHTRKFQSSNASRSGYFTTLIYLTKEQVIQVKDLTSILQCLADPIENWQSRISKNDFEPLSLALIEQNVVTDNEIKPNYILQAMMSYVKPDQKRSIILSLEPNSYDENIEWFNSWWTPIWPVLRLQTSCAWIPYPTDMPKIENCPTIVLTPRISAAWKAREECLEDIQTDKTTLFNAIRRQWLNEYDSPFSQVIKQLPLYLKCSWQDLAYVELTIKALDEMCRFEGQSSNLMRMYQILDVYLGPWLKDEIIDNQYLDNLIVAMNENISRVGTLSLNEASVLGGMSDRFLLKSTQLKLSELISTSITGGESLTKAVKKSLKHPDKWLNHVILQILKNCQLTKPLIKALLDQILISNTLELDFIFSALGNRKSIVESLIEDLMIENYFDNSFKIKLTQMDMLKYNWKSIFIILGSKFYQEKYKCLQFIFENILNNNDMIYAISILIRVWGEEVLLNSVLLSELEDLIPLLSDIIIRNINIINSYQISDFMVVVWSFVINKTDSNFIKFNQSKFYELLDAFSNKDESEKIFQTYINLINYFDQQNLNLWEYSYIKREKLWQRHISKAYLTSTAQAFFRATEPVPSLEKPLFMEVKRLLSSSENRLSFHALNFISNKKIIVQIDLDVIENYLFPSMSKDEIKDILNVHPDNKTFVDKIIGKFLGKTYHNTYKPYEQVIFDEYLKLEDKIISNYRKNVNDYFPPKDEWWRIATPLFAKICNSQSMINACWLQAGGCIEKIPYAESAQQQWILILDLVKQGQAMPINQLMKGILEFTSGDNHGTGGDIELFRALLFYCPS